MTNKTNTCRDLCYVVGEEDSAQKNRDFLLKQYEVLVNRKNQRDTFVWAIPALIVAAEVNLISAVVNAQSWKSAWPIGVIGIGLGTVSYQLMSRHYYLAKMDEYRLAELEKKYFPLCLYTTPSILQDNLREYLGERMLQTSDVTMVEHYRRMHDKLANVWNPGLYHSAPYWKGLLIALGWIPLLLTLSKYKPRIDMKKLPKFHPFRWRLRK